MPKEKSIDIDTEKDFKNALKYNQCKNMLRDILSGKKF